MKQVEQQAAAPTSKTRPARMSKQKKQEAVRALVSRINGKMTAGQLFYLAVHLDVAKAMVDRWLEKQTLEVREEFKDGMTWMSPQDQALSRDPKIARSGRNQLKCNRAWFQDHMRKQEAESAQTTAEKKKTRMRLGL